MLSLSKISRVAWKVMRIQGRRVCSQLKTEHHFIGALLADQSQEIRRQAALVGSQPNYSSVMLETLLNAGQLTSQDLTQLQTLRFNNNLGALAKVVVLSVQEYDRMDHLDTAPPFRQFLLEQTSKHQLQLHPSHIQSIQSAIQQHSHNAYFQSLQDILDTPKTIEDLLKQTGLESLVQSEREGLQIVGVDWERYSVELKNVQSDQRVHIIGLEEGETPGVAQWMTALGADLLLLEDQPPLVNDLFLYDASLSEQENSRRFHKHAYYKCEAEGEDLLEYVSDKLRVGAAKVDFQKESVVDGQGKCLPVASALFRFLKGCPPHKRPRVRLCDYPLSKLLYTLTQQSTVAELEDLFLKCNLVKLMGTYNELHEQIAVENKCGQCGTGRPLKDQPVSHILAGDPGLDYFPTQSEHLAQQTYHWLHSQPKSKTVLVVVTSQYLFSLLPRLFTLFQQHRLTQQIHSAVAAHVEAHSRLERYQLTFPSYSHQQDYLQKTALLEVLFGGVDSHNLLRIDSRIEKVLSQNYHQSCEYYLSSFGIAGLSIDPTLLEQYQFAASQNSSQQEHPCPTLQALYSDPYQTHQQTQQQQIPSFTYSPEQTALYQQTLSEFSQKINYKEKKVKPEEEDDYKPKIRYRRSRVLRKK